MNAKTATPPRSTFRIENGVPMPPPRTRGCPYPFLDMMPSQSFFVQCKACRREARIERHQTRGDAAREQQRRRYATDAAYRERKLAYWRAYVKTDAGRESRRITQRAARAFKRACAIGTEQRT